MLPPAPPLLSITICWPSVLLISCATMRACTSVGPPAGNGTMSLTGLEGYVSAETWPATVDAPRQINKPNFRASVDLEIIVHPPDWFLFYRQPYRTAACRASFVSLPPRGERSSSVIDQTRGYPKHDHRRRDQKTDRHDGESSGQRMGGALQP